MCTFINQQRGTYVQAAPNSPVDQYGPVNYERTIRYDAPVPLGRSDDGVWEPDQYGYTDFDDFHLACYGA